MTYRTIILNGENKEDSKPDLDFVFESLKQRNSWLHSQKVEDLLDYFDGLGRYWKENKEQKFGSNLKYLSEFLEKTNLTRELKLSLRGNIHVLDDFVELQDDTENLYHAQPRGISVHWIAGNVDVLGIFSVVHALLTKNLCVIKAPQNYSLLKNLLLSFNEVSTNSIKGSDILQCIALVYVDKDDIANQTILSKNADIRIAWGGQEAVSAILSFEKNFFTEDIVYGPKYSYAILDSEFLKKNLQQTAQHLALDISVFDQYACNSPHTIFIENGEDDSALAKNFAKELSKSMDAVSRMIITKPPISEQKSMEIQSVRTEYDFKGEVYAPKNTDWTVIYSDEEGLAQPCFSRVVFVRPIDDLTQINKFHNRKIQSIGLGISDPKKRKTIADKLTLLGGDRCPSIGNMSKFTSPWDGMFSMDRMIRWVPLPKY